MLRRFPWEEENSAIPSRIGQRAQQSHRETNRRYEFGLLQYGGMSESSFLNRTLALPIAFCFAVALFSIVGCDHVPPRPAIDRGEARPKISFAEARKDDSLEADSTASDESIPEKDESIEDAKPVVNPIRNRWYACFAGSEQVGFQNVSVENVGDGGELLRYQIVNQLTLPTIDQASVRWQRQTLMEKSSGQFTSFEVESNFGGRASYVSVDTDTKIRVRRKMGRESYAETYQWSDQIRGPYGVQQSLRSDPMKVGETRKLLCLLPPAFEPSLVTLNAVAMANIALLETESQQLLEIEKSVEQPGMPILESLIWVDETGEVLQSYEPASDFRVIHCKRETAIQDQVVHSNLQDAMSVLVVEPERSDTSPQSRTYRISHPSVNPADLFAQSECQSINTIDDHTAIVMLGNNECSADSVETSDQDRGDNVLIESKSGSVSNMTTTLLSQSKLSILEKCDVLRDGVSTLMNKLEFSLEIQSATSAVTNSEGDCKDCSLLLAACLRSQKIPSRIAVGMLIETDQTTNETRAYYHMWTLAWTGERWMPLDTFVAPENLLVDRIQFASSNLSDTPPYELVLPVMQRISELRIERVAQ